MGPSCYDEEFARRAIGRGTHGASWLQEIPRLIRQFEDRWRISVGPPYSLSYNYVAAARMHDGTPAVLKIGFPEDPEIRSEIEALKLYNGDGAVRLIHVDDERGIMLLERLEPGVPLSDLDDDQQSTIILADVMKALWKPAPERHSFPSVADWAGGIDRYRHRYAGRRGPLPSHLVEKARDLFAELLASGKEPVLAHGDLHHYNVLSAARRPWLAIDPKGVIAEPAYDTAAMLRNPAHIWRSTELDKLLYRRIAILSEQLEIDARRILNWGLAQTVLSAVWTTEDHSTGWEPAIAVARSLDRIHFQ